MVANVISTAYNLAWSSILHMEVGTKNVSRCHTRTFFWTGKTETSSLSLSLPGSLYSHDFLACQVLIIHCILHTPPDKTMGFLICPNRCSIHLPDKSGVSQNMHKMFILQILIQFFCPVNQ